MASRDDNAGCPFCSLTEGEIVLCNDHALAFRDNYPVSRGHTLVVPRRHVASIFDCPPHELAALWELVARVRRDLAADLAPEGFNVGVNDGDVAGQTIGHGHVHVIPRFRGDVPDPRGGVRWVIPEKAVYWSS